MAADGKITIDARLENKEFKAGSAELLRNIKSLQHSVESTGKSMRSSAAGYGEALRNNARAAREFRDELKSLERETAQMRKDLDYRGNQTGAKQFLEITDKIRKYEKAMQSAQERADKLYNQMGDKAFNSSEYQKADETVTRLAQKIENLKKQRDNIGVSDADVLNFRSQEQSVEQMEERLRELRQVSAGAGSSFGIIMRQAGGAAASIARIAGHGVLAFLRKLAEGAKNAAVQLAKLAKRAITTGIRKLAGFAGNAAKSLFHLGKGAKQSNTGFKLGLKNVLRYGLGIRSLFVLFNRLRTAIKEGFEQLAKSNPQVQASLTSLKSALNGLKGSLASAFAPILTAIAPALTTLINLLTQAVNAIGMFFAALTGQAFYSVAKGIGAIGSGAKSAGGAAKQLKRELAGFDELNILSDKSGGGGGGGGGGSGAGFAYSQVPISEGIRNFVDELKRLFEAGEYEAIGRVIADGINKAIQKVQDYIKWDNIGPTITKALEVVTGAINGLFDGIDWENLGATFGEGLNTITNTLLKWYRGIDWYNIGSGIARGMNGLVDRVDWANIGKTIREKAHSLILTLRGAFENFSWSHAGEAFASTVNALFKDPKTWEDAGKAIDAALNGALDFVGKFLGKLDGKQIAIDIKAALGQIRWGDIWSKFKEDARLAFGTVGDFLRELLGGSREYGTSVEDALAEHLALRNGRTGGNNSTATLGELIGQGLSTAITGALKLIKDFFDNDIPWDTWGNEIHKMIINIDWVDVADKLWDAIVSASRGLGRLIIAAMFGSDSKIYKWLFPEKPGAKGMKGIVDQILGDTSPAMQKAGNTIAESILKGGTELRDVSWLTEKQKQQLGLRGSESQEKVLDYDLLGISHMQRENAWADVLERAIEKGRPDWIEELREADPSFYEKHKEDVGVALTQAAFNEFKGSKPLIPFESALKEFEGSKPLLPIQKVLEKVQKPIQTTAEVLKAMQGKPNTTLLGKLGSSMTEGNIGWMLAAGFDKANKVKVGVDYTPDGANGSSFVNRPLEWLANALKPGAILDVKSRLTGKTGDSKTPSGIYGTFIQLAAKLTGKSADSKTPSGIYGTVLQLGAKLTGKTKDSKTAAIIYGTVTNFLAKMTGKDKNSKTASDVFGTVANFVSNLTGKKSGTKGVTDIYGSIATFIANLTNRGSNWQDGLLKWMTGNKNGNVTITISVSGGVQKLGNDIAKAFKKSAGLASGGIVTAGGRVLPFANGGYISGAAAGFWNSIPKYAHGTLFAAGEAGPEVVGHIGGRTEVLNRSQLAQTMQSAVYSGMVAAMSRITFRMPAMASGAVMPYEVMAQIARTGQDIQRSIDANTEDLIQAFTSIVSAQTNAIVNALRTNRNTSTTSWDADRIIAEINHRTLMYSASPLKGV